MIRNAAPEDAGRLFEIYPYYVKETAVTFDYEVPSPEEFRSRIAGTLKKYPFLVLETDGGNKGLRLCGKWKRRGRQRGMITGFKDGEMNKDEIEEYRLEREEG